MSKQPTRVEVFTFELGQDIKEKLEGWARQHEARILSVAVDRPVHSVLNATLLTVIVWEPLNTISEDDKTLTNVVDRLLAAATRQQEQLKELVRENARLSEENARLKGER